MIVFFFLRCFCFYFDLKKKVKNNAFGFFFYFCIYLWSFNNFFVCCLCFKPFHTKNITFLFPYEFVVFNTKTRNSLSFSISRLVLLQRTAKSQVSRGTNFRIQDTTRLNCFRFVSSLLLRYICDACV